ncbi:MAG: esterase/lipase family protein, partial [Ornithinimicrobium sp.]|uniref:esterase/lipase family protein n=1 Tax=Ornithinimicrobium sp. TaxID=1977084 RepID=UPI003D9B243B
SLTTEAHREDEGGEPGQYQEFDLESAALALFELIEQVKDRTGSPRVYLVAHSMGGLICRCLIQKVLPDRGDHALNHIDRFFTYGTPHGGIHFDVGFGLLERMRDTFNIQGGNIFGPRQMYDYLTPERDRLDAPPSGWVANSIPAEAFPGDRVCCLVGTNPSDYDVAGGLSAKAVGPKSDGLVQIESAYIPEANFAFVHRSHSGRYGLVNSEEGYQNLRRFLFGDLQITADLVGYRLPGEPDPEVTWQAETRLSVRGLPIVMHEQLAAHHCPIQLEWPKSTDTADRPTPLVTTFLSSRESRPDTAKMRYMLQLKVLSLRERGGIFSFDDHIEQSADFDDMLVVDVEPPTAGRSAPRAWATWASQVSSPLRDYEPPDSAVLTDEDDAQGLWVAHVPLPSPSGLFLGETASVRLTVRNRLSPRTLVASSASG